MSARQTAFCFVFFCLLTYNASAQGRFKGGLGYNFISNSFDDQNLGDYFAPSLHLSYALVRSTQFSFGVESGTALKARQTAERERIIFLSALPLIAQYDWRKVGLHAGTGPAYLVQKDITSQHNSSYSGFFLQSLAGISFKAKPIIGDLLYPEFQVRLSYLKNMKDKDQGMGALSVIAFLRSR